MSIAAALNHCAGSHHRQRQQQTDSHCQW